MSTKATVLRESRHRELLQARRQDPVTHEIFSAGDRVTRCASCLVPFLEQSWEAIGRTHCGQFASVPLDDCDPVSAESSSTPDAKECKGAKPKADRMELTPIPITLREVPITLR